MNGGRWRPGIWVVGGLLFTLVLTANSGGYRYGASDQAFHIPAVLRALNPASFPRDAALIDSQARFTIFYEIVAAIVRSTGASLESIFLAGYLTSVAILWVALILIGEGLFRSPWGLLALSAIVTLRHRIPRTSVNSFEPYFYPRTLAFAIGLVAIAALLRRRTWLAVALTAAASLTHPTTGLWFVVLIGSGVLVLEPRARRFAWPFAAFLGAAGVWALAKGPLASSMVTMDATWLAAVESKSDLFPSDWPAWAWVANLALPALLWWIHQVRRSRGSASREDGALVYGALVLAALFLLSVPAVAMRWALPVELQVSRVFWIIEFLLVIYGIALVAERMGVKARQALVALAVGLLVIAAGRGAYVMRVEFPDRGLFETHLRPTPWQDAMLWVKRQPIDVHVWADPGHAWKYGTSVRVAGQRDVFLEETKDSAVAIYSREVAVRVNERRSLPVTFEPTPDGTAVPLAAQLAEHYGVDYLVTESELPLPLAYHNSRFRIYGLRARR